MGSPAGSCAHGAARLVVKEPWLVMGGSNSHLDCINRLKKKHYSHAVRRPISVRRCYNVLKEGGKCWQDV